MEDLVPEGANGVFLNHVNIDRQRAGIQGIYQILGAIMGKFAFNNPAAVNNRLVHHGSGNLLIVKEDAQGRMGGANSEVSSPNFWEPSPFNSNRTIQSPLCLEDIPP